MDKVSPDFSTALVKTKSWTDVECSLGDDKNIDLVEDGSSTPIPTCDGLQIVEAHTVVDVDTSPLEGECANDGSDCFVSEVFTPAVACKQEGINGETALPTSVEAATHPEGTVMPVGIDDTDLQPPAKKRSITAYAEQFMDDEVLADPLPPAAEPPAPPMLFGSFVDPGKGDPNILVSLESAELWHQFYQAGTEMIITKSGR